MIFVFGKHYYALESEKKKRNLADTAIIRIEEICPFPAAQIRSIVAQYKNADQFIWAQEGINIHRQSIQIYESIISIYSFDLSTTKK